MTDTGNPLNYCVSSSPALPPGSFYVTPAPLHSTSQTTLLLSTAAELRQLADLLEALARQLEELLQP